MPLSTENKLFCLCRVAAGNVCRGICTYAVRLNEEAPTLVSCLMKKCLSIALLSLALWSCKKAAAPSGVPGRWNVTSDDIEKYISAPPEIIENITIKEHPWFQFNNDGTGAFMRDTPGAGGVTNFTYALSRDSTVSYYQPTININVPPQVLDGVHIDGYFLNINIDQLNTQVLKIDYMTYTADGTWQEYIGMNRVN
jgi:hypothetical protein